MKKTIVYIDGFNLYYRLRKTPYRWLNLEKLSQIYLNPNQHDIIKIKYFTARVKRDAEDDSNIIRQSMYLRAIKTIPKLDIIYGQFKKRQVAGLLCDFEDRKQLNKNIVKITKWEEKMSDVHIATQLIADAYQKKCAVLFFSFLNSSCDIGFKAYIFDPIPLQLPALHEAVNEDDIDRVKSLLKLFNNEVLF